MPLPPLTPDNTNRLFITYTSCYKEHTAQFRYGGSAGPPSGPFLTSVGTLLTQLAYLFCTDWALSSATYSEQGSNVRLTVPGYTLPSVTGHQTPQATNSPYFATFVGRSSGGRRWRQSFLGVGPWQYVGSGDGDDYRILATEDAGIAGMISAMATFAPIAIDGNLATVYSYVNIGVNAYWQRALRP